MTEELLTHSHDEILTGCHINKVATTGIENDNNNSNYNTDHKNNDENTK